MKYLLFFLLCSSVVAQDRYKAITDRNAFALLDEVPARTTITPIIVQPPIKLNLTGIITRRGVTNVYLFTKDIPKRFLTLSTLRRTDSGVTLLSVEKGLVEVNNNGTVELLSFDTHKLPNVVTLPALKATPTVVKKKDSKNKYVKIAPATPKPNCAEVGKFLKAVTPFANKEGCAPATAGAFAVSIYFITFKPPPEPPEYLAASCKASCLADKPPLAVVAPALPNIPALAKPVVAATLPPIPPVAADNKPNSTRPLSSLP